VGLFSWFRKKSTDQAPPYLHVWEYTSKSAPERKGNEFLKAYSEISWIYAAVRLIAQNIAQATLRLYRIKNDGSWDEVTEHDVLSLLDRPNPFLTRYDKKHSWYCSFESDTDGAGIGKWPSKKMVIRTGARERN